MNIEKHGYDGIVTKTHERVFIDRYGGVVTKTGWSYCN